MLKKLTVLVILSLLLTACYQYNEPKKPDNLISKKKMANILIDLRLIRSVTGNNKKVLDTHNVKAAQYVYKKYDIDSLQFALSNNYYAFHVQEYEDIYALMKDSLDGLKIKYKTLIDEETKAKKKADSIEKAKKRNKNKKIEHLKDSIKTKPKGLIKPVSDK
ncbi:hypothetical protein GCM10022291_08970 [Postechiella marina]|uniref:DUF4296 domain-containing protein n=1 Tax=Postechiella marina TaxID=943941 RepID=A0ABP8C3H3_9FLAO